MSVSTDVVVKGYPSDNLLAPNQSSIGFIESPRYPDAYPRALQKKYTLINMKENGYVRLVFDDFNVHFQSEMQIVDSDDRVLLNTKRENRRPPAIISSGNSLFLYFKAHDFTRTVGFRARYEFVDEREWSDKPNARDCDDFLEGYGGEIKLDGNQELINTYVDCIWIIGRFPHMARTFDRIYLKVEEFHMKGVGLRLEIRAGPSSTSDRLLLLLDSQTHDQVQHKQPRHGFATTSSAFYIRLRGYLMGTNGLEIVYSQFYRWATALCPGIGEFHCDNARCIKSSSRKLKERFVFMILVFLTSPTESKHVGEVKKKTKTRPRRGQIVELDLRSSNMMATLRCDGINHCGDGSDEHCQRPISDFKEPDADISGLLALVIGVCGLILLIISTTAVMGRFYRRRLTAQSGGTDLPGTASYPPDSTAPSIQTVGERRFYVVPESQISVIEAPPSYDDALKHPPVSSSRGSAFLNRAFVDSASEERMVHVNTPDVPPPTRDAIDPIVDDVSGEIGNESRESTGSALREEDEQPTFSGVSPNSQRKDDESWV
ncbi:unnamed protein product [Haemonchus placei]|uniref:CUB domain-containing protein n=1 Tax=Haemonchus placei TaxID=6290 RepID=A0A0N4WQZ8_HAEPC|nr:unnamed protein product [Haemonchus placei]